MKLNYSWLAIALNGKAIELKMIWSVGALGLLVFQCLCVLSNPLTTVKSTKEGNIFNILNTF